VFILGPGVLSKKTTWSDRKCMNLRYRTHDEGNSYESDTFWLTSVEEDLGQQPANLAHPYRNRIANFPKKIIRSKINRNASRVNDSVPYPFPLFALLVQKSSPLPSFVRTVAFMQDLSIATSLWPKRNMIIRAIRPFLISKANKELLQSSHGLLIIYVFYSLIR